MRKFFCVFFFLNIITTSLFPIEELFQPQNEQEALFLRRIIEFNKDKDYELLQSQIEEYLKNYPKGIFADGLKAFMGDLFMQDDEYSIAIKYYDRIQDSNIKDKIALNHLQSLYKINAYETIIDKFQPYLEEDLSEKNLLMTYLYADSLYRFALTQKEDKEKNTLLALAAKYFERIETNHKPSNDETLDTKKPLAHIYYLLNLKDKGAEIYVKLAEKATTNKEELLLQAASIFSEIDKDRAIQLYGQICRIGKRHVSDAALNRMILLFETKRYPEIILAKQQLARFLDPSEIHLLHFFLGQSHFKTKDYKRAKKEIEDYLAYDEENLERKKLALSSLFEIANSQENIFLIDKTVEKFEQSFPGDVKLYQAYFARALLNKKNGQYQKAEKDFIKLLEQNSWSDKEENILFEYAHMLFLTSRFKDARKHFRQWTNTFVGRPLTPLAWRYLVHSSIGWSEKHPLDNSIKEKLILDLEEFLSMPSLATEKEIKEYFFLLAKANYETQDYEESLSILEDLLAKALPEKTAHDCHLLLAYVYKEGKNNLVDFCKHMEEALLLESKTNDKANLHLCLFNAYLKLAEKDKNLFVNAADHLYHAFEMNLSLEKDNLLWLANFYYQKSDKSPLNTLRSIHLYETVLTKENIEKDATDLEDDILNLSELYLKEKQEDKMAALLEILESQYTRLDQVQWKYSELVRFNLAKQYEKKQNPTKAVIFYDQIYAHSPNLKDPLSAEAALRSAQIRIAQLKPEKIQSNNPEIHQVLKQLKDLIIQKNISNEPLHLQAALEYVELQASLCSDKEREQKRKEFLEKVKKDFQSDLSVIGKEYRKNKRRFPEKKQICDAYMQFIDIQLLSSQIDSTENEENQKLRDKVLVELKKLLKNPVLQDDLRKRITSHIDNLQL